MPSEDAVWLGVPLSEGDADVTDAFVSRIGGKATLLRALTSAEKPLPSSFECPKCKSVEHVSLLAQLYAPLECYDRVLYVLTCAACGVLPGPQTEGAAMATAPPLPATNNPHSSSNSSGGSKKGAANHGPAKTSYCFVVRCQNFSEEYYKGLVQEHRRRVEAQAKAKASAAAAKGGGGALFKEADDWGADDWGSEGNASEEAPDETAGPEEAPEEEEEEAPLPPLQPTFPLAVKGSVVSLKGRLYTNGLPLDLFVEQGQRQERLGSTEEQLKEAQRRYGMDAGTLDTTSFEEDDETPAEKVVHEYVERIERTPSQCVRWCPGGTPLRSCLMPSLQSIPACPLCQAPRRFECQLTAPIVYYLTKGIGESKNVDLHFSNVHVFTCSKNCYSGEDKGYVTEHVVVEDEI